MKQIHLYIGSREVEFSSPPDILYTYQQDDLTNPTAIKNSFSKTITIDGTPSNNQLFGEYWNVERLQGGGGNGEGSYFNASKKAPFTLYIDHDIYETGYARLDKINTTDKTITYDISLFGLLGDFFYNLSINEDGDPLKLSDLNYMGNADSTHEFDFVTNINTVNEAWRVLAGTLNPNRYRKWNYINFMPCYNGIPDDFDADKVIINTDGTTLVKTSGNYSTREGFVCGKLPSEMTEWEIRDLRSYLQRPVIRMKEIIKACTDTTVNGGYTVELDPDFFNNNNPYWNDTWLTLPMVQNLEYSNTEQILTGATLLAQPTSGSVTGKMYQDLTFSLGEFSQAVPSSIRVSGRISVDTAYRNTSYAWFWNYNGDDYHTGWWCLGSLFCQLIALNGDTVVGASNVYNLTTPIRHNGKLYYGNQDRYDGGHKYNVYMDKTIYNVLGDFRNGVFTEEGADTPRTFTFTINNLQSSITDLKMVYYWGATSDKIKHFGSNWVFNKTYSNGWTTQSYSSQSTALDDFTITNLGTNIQAVVGGSLGRTGTEVNKALLLNSEHTPCEYLLSYCKMFGLHFSKDPTENIIRIETRKTFYNRDDVANLNDIIDRSKDITINPIAFDTKWYQFKQDADKTQFYDNYQTKYGVEYGSKILNTGYEFNSEKKQLLEDNVIKSAVEGMEKSKYFTAYSNDNAIRPWFGYGLTYELYSGENTKTITASTTNSGTINGINEEDGMKYYDLFPKVQFHDKDNKGTDGKDCLVFFSGVKNLSRNRAVPLSYYLTDDTPAQKTLNEGTPCWLFTPKEYVGGVRIAYKLSSIPVFERYLTSQTSGKVTRSLDFGSAQELFIPTYSLTDDVNIYYNFWKTYLEDLYDINTKVLKCFVKLDGRPNQDWLRRFYWFDNAIWRINKITDWNPSSYDTTQMEFVKVQNISDYTSKTQGRPKAVVLTSNKYVVSADGDMATLTVTTTDAQTVRLISDSSNIIINKVGDDEYEAVISQNNTGEDRQFYITAVDDEGNNSRIYIKQSYEGSTTLAANPNTLIVPSSGGVYDIDFEWFNQEDNYIDDYDIFGNVEASADILSEQESNRATMEVDPNTGSTAISGYLMFMGGNNSVNVYIDQMPASINYGGLGGSYTLAFTYTASPAFLEVPYWVNVVSNGDGTYNLVAETNLYEQGRDANIVVGDGVHEATIAVHQAEGGINQQYATNVTPTNMYFAGGSMGSNEGQYLTITCNEPWTITNLSDTWPFISQYQGDGGINIVLVYPKTTHLATRRSASFNVNIGSQVFVVNVFQGTSSPALTVSPTTASVASGQSTVDITVNYSGRGGFNVVPQPSSTACTCTPISWTGETGTTTATIAANDTADTRTITVTFTGATTALTASTVITQAAAPAEAAFSDRALFGDGGFETLQTTLSANTPWTATTSDNWITLQSSSGSGGTTAIDILLVRNRTELIRRGYVDVYAVSDPTTRLARLQINQATFSSSLSVRPSSLEYTSAGGTQNINVSSDALISWYVDGTLPTWLLVSPTSGTGAGTISVTAAANNLDSRSAFFAISNGDRSVFINISQEGAQQVSYADVSNAQLYFEASEPIFYLESVTANTTWAAVASDSWIQLGSTTGDTGTTSFGISCTENTTQQTRTGTISIRKNRPTGTILNTISVTQYGDDGPHPRPEPYDPYIT